MNELRELASAWLRQRRPAYIIELADVAGSVPREAGTRLLVAADEVAGTIGGGRLEFEAIRQARAAMPAARCFERRFALGPSLGQCCGGAVTLRFLPLAADGIAAWPDEPALFHLQLHGAGHVGRAILRLLEGLPVTVDWIDERDEEFAVYTRERQETGCAAMRPGITLTAVDSVAAEVPNAPPGAFYLVLTHSHELDLAICEAVLRRADAGFLGLIGSRTKRARFASRLAERGFDDPAIARLTSPIGIAGIRSKRPEVIAVGVVAQLLAVAAGAHPAGGTI